MALEAPTIDYEPDLAKKRTQFGEKPMQTDTISCLAFNQKEIYISCEGIVYPCCWTARFARNIYLGRKTRDGFSSLFCDHDGKNKFDLRLTDLETAMQNTFLDALADLWKSKQPSICYLKCGKKDQPEKVKLKYF